MIYFFLFIIGLCIGSFLNVVVDRSVRQESFITNRSHCEFCNHILAWYDLIPLVSFILIHGKCRYCKKKIGWKYPLIEICTGVLFIITFLCMQNSIYINYQTSNIKLFIELGFYLFITCSLLIIFFADFFYGIIPDIVLLPMFILTLLHLLLTNSSQLPSALLSAFGAGLFFLIIFLISKGKGMGLGDVKFAFIIGFLVRFPAVVLALYLAFLTGAIASLILVIAKKKRLKGSTIAFGPFLVIGTYICMFFGSALWQQILIHLF